MSRVAKAPVELPSGVQVTLSGSHIAIKGKNGQLEMDIHQSMSKSSRTKMF